MNLGLVGFAYQRQALGCISERHCLHLKAPDAMASRIQEIRNCLFQEVGGTTCQEHQAHWGNAARTQAQEF